MQKVRELIGDSFAITAQKIADAGKVILSCTGKSGYIAPKIVGDAPHDEFNYTKYE